jgi:hypothetical protein
MHRVIYRYLRHAYTIIPTPSLYKTQRRPFLHEKPQPHSDNPGDE